MRRLLLASVITLVPFVAFAHGNQGGAASLSATGSMSNSGVSADQGTHAGAVTVGNGSAHQSAQSGNMATVTSTGKATAVPGKTTTSAVTTQEQSGYTTITGKSSKTGAGSKAGGFGTGGESTSVFGQSNAAGANLDASFTVMPHGR